MDFLHNFRIIVAINIRFYVEVVSWFYYWRSAWNIVERKLQYPDEPLPDPKNLRMDFDTCVLEGMI